MVIKSASNPRRRHSRFAVVISKKVMKSAVGRNRIRRRIYEILRKHLGEIKENTDVVLIVVSAEPRTMLAADLEASLLDAIKQAHIYKTSSETAIL